MLELIKARLASPLYSHGRKLDLDYWLLVGCLCLLGLGLVMNASASSAVALANKNDVYHYFVRHLAYVVVALLFATATLLVSTKKWLQLSWLLLGVGLALLVLVYVPGIGHEVNGSKRWLNLGIIKLQSSELAKLFMVVFMAGYLVRHGDELKRKLFGFFRPLGILLVFAVLIYHEPDFGATTVMIGSVVMMIFLAGTSLKVAMPLLAIVAALAVTLVSGAGYRMERLLVISDPWQNQFGAGYQLTQALIAFGRGEWFGTGLGNSIQKQFYLPEAHTDFVFAVLAEELGMVGSLLTLAFFVFICLRALQIGVRAERVGLYFSAYMSYGIAMIWTGQTFINIGVNIGLLPTKGLTLPFVSYGGSSLVVCCIEMAILLRVEWEVRQKLQQQQPAVMTGNDLKKLAREAEYAS